MTGKALDRMCLPTLLLGKRLTPSRPYPLMAVIFLLLGGDTLATDYELFPQGTDVSGLPSTVYNDPVALLGPGSPLVAGDSVDIKSGVHWIPPGGIKIDVSGEPGNPIVFSGQGLGQTAFRSMRTLAGWVADPIRAGVYAAPLDFLPAQAFFGHRDTPNEIAMLIPVGPVAPAHVFDWTDKGEGVVRATLVPGQSFVQPEVGGEIVLEASPPPGQTVISGALRSRERPITRLGSTASDFDDDSQMNDFYRIVHVAEDGRTLTLQLMHAGKLQPGEIFETTGASELRRVFADWGLDTGELTPESGETGRFRFVQESNTLEVHLADPSMDLENNPDLFIQVPESDQAGATITDPRDFLPMLQIYGSYLKFDGISFEGGQASLVTVTGPRMRVDQEPASQVEFTRCRFRFGGFAGLSFRGKGHRLEESVVEYNGNSGLGGGFASRSEISPRLPYPDGPFIEDELFQIEDFFVQDIAIRRSVISNNGFFDFYGGFHDGGMKIIGACRGWEVSESMVMDNGGHGLWFDYCLGGHRVENNVISGNRQAITFEATFPHPDERYSGVVKNNLVISRGEATIGVAVSSAAGVLMDHNTVIVGDRSATSRLGRGGGGVLIGRIDEGRREGLEEIMGDHPSNVSVMEPLISADRSVLEYNIVSSFDRPDFDVFTSARDSEANRSDLNFFVEGTPAETLYRYQFEDIEGEVSIIPVGSLSELQWLPENSVFEPSLRQREGDPLFVDPDRDDYRLAIGSPARSEARLPDGSSHYGADLDRLPDLDGDGLPDWWEVSWVGLGDSDSFSDLFPMSPSGNDDGDRLTNLEEYFAGSNPFEADAHSMHIVALDKNPQTQELSLYLMRREYGGQPVFVNAPGEGTLFREGPFEIVGVSGNDQSLQLTDGALGGLWMAFIQGGEMSVRNYRTFSQYRDYPLDGRAVDPSGIKGIVRQGENLFVVYQSGGYHRVAWLSVGYRAGDF
ncbi:MAG: right-handed parallel beta-helix repeat-containing protein, partial [Acidobacteriota bacterium]